MGGFPDLKQLAWEVYGFDGGKLVKGRKRHIVVDSQGLVIGVLVSETNLSERLGAVVVLDEAREELSQTEVIWVNRGYSGENFAPVVQQICGARVEVIERIGKTLMIKTLGIYRSINTFDLPSTKPTRDVQRFAGDPG